MLNATNGIFAPVLSDAKKFDASGNTISQGEANKLISKMKRALAAEYAGSSSSTGLARDRNVLARTCRAIVRNSDQGKWALTGPARQALKDAFGPKFDGKACSIGKLVDQIRSEVKKNASSYTYSG